MTIDVKNIARHDLFQLSHQPALRGRFTVPGDKSISHRSMIFGALAEGVTTVKGFLRSEDCLATMNIMRQLGVVIDDNGDEIKVHGVGLHGLKAAAQDLDCGNAGTAMRLLSGLLAAQDFESTLVGDDSLSGRPMNRVIKPLSTMGADIASDEGTAPLVFRANQASNKIQAIDYLSPIASAQVKSAVLLGGLFAEGVTSVVEPKKSRDHTETMLQGFGAEVAVDGLKVSVKGLPTLKAQDIQVPADISSAAFFMVLGLIHPDADFVIENVCINKTRDGVIHILQAMGGDIELSNVRDQAGESVADLRVKSSKLKGIDVPHDLIPSAIDEFPVVFVAAAHATGAFKLTGAEELKHKESDRIEVMVAGLKKLGVDCESLDDGAVIRGCHNIELNNACVDGHGDHRCAMSFLVASALQPEYDMAVKGCHNIATSFPDFFDLMQGLSMNTQSINPVITIDGPSGVGKGTTSALLAEALGWHLLDSGAIYRAMALKAISEGITPENEAALKAAAESLDLRFEVAENSDIAVFLDGQQVNEQLRTEACGEMASKIAPNKAMRAALFDRQKDFQQAPGLVADGRDMGTVVFQSAPLKVFLTASAEERAKRRHKQLQRKGVDVRIRDLLKDIEARDLRDSSRKVAPLVPASDAHIIDTSDLSIDEVLSQVLALARNVGLTSD